MKRTEYYVKMFLFTTGIATLVILGSQLLRGRELDDVLASSFGWAALASAIFTARRYHLWKTGAPCAMCVDVEDAK